MFRFIFLFFCVSTVLFSCKQRVSQIAQEKDYTKYLRPELCNIEKKKNADEIDFWQQRLEKDTSSYVNKLELANHYLHRFRLTGEISSLSVGDSLLKKSSEKLNNREAGILFTLSQNAVTQHQFSRAASYNEQALRNNGDPYTVQLLRFDACMELGRYADAEKAMNEVKNSSSFDYLIRRAKWEDHNGNSSEAIRLMEQAFEKVKNKKKSLYCWTLSNLADMYGHAGEIKKSYKAYLDVIQKDPANLYCLKGIAWIAYSHDGNNSAAKHILQYILSQTKMPDLKLILAEIAESENNATEKNKWLNEFLLDVEQPAYGGMYNKYLISIYNDDAKQYQKAISLAENELKNRSTPETCDWLAWSYYKSGNSARAMEYSRNAVHMRIFEPDAQMHTGFIFADNGRKIEAEKLLKQCLESSFELGPVAIRKIKEKLASL